ncbi:MAG: hypothetical protein N4A53_01615 [Pelagimonas sp.]|jgi:hypothetical protein|nr:hypothetical protein [Pelagimonas sp.]
MSLRWLPYLAWGLFGGGLMVNGLLQWWINPEKFDVSARLYPHVIAGLLWLAAAYQAIDRFKRPVLGWSMVVLGIGYLAFGPFWSKL